MLSVKYYLKSPKELKNTILVRIRDGRRFDFTSATDEYVNLEDWNAKNGCCLSSIEELKNGKIVSSRSAETRNRLSTNVQVNRNLIKLSELIEDGYKKSDKTTISKGWLQRIIYPERFKVEEKIEPNLLEYASIYLADKTQEFERGKRKEATLNKTKCIIEILKRFFKYEGVTAPMMTEIDRNFQRCYDDYCVEVEGYMNSYSNRTFKAIKTMCFHASANGYQINPGIRHLKIQLSRTTYPTLSFEELELLENHNYQKPYLENARDWLIIGAFCGQRCSDFLKFNTSMIETELVDGKETFFICFTQQKTEKHLRLALHEKIVKILNRRDWQFPNSISSQRFNEYIKEVAELGGIIEPCEGGISMVVDEKSKKIRKVFGTYPKWKLITSHLCRRSFCTNFYGLISTTALMTASGHTNEKQLREYIQDVDRKQAENFARELNLINTINLK